jgi:hypothetical protein
VDYAKFVRKLELPRGYAAPTSLRYEDLVAAAITRADLHDDARGINASMALIQRTRGGGWPVEPVTEAFNFVDLVWHELEFREGDSFTYVVRDANGGYVRVARPDLPRAAPLARRGAPLRRALLLRRPGPCRVGDHSH